VYLGLTSVRATALRAVRAAGIDTSSLPSYKKERTVLVLPSSPLPLPPIPTRRMLLQYYFRHCEYFHPTVDESVFVATSEREAPAAGCIVTLVEACTLATLMALLATALQNQAPAQRSKASTVTPEELMRGAREVASRVAEQYSPTIDLLEFRRVDICKGHW
jgi:hypothetical protein